MNTRCKFLCKTVTKHAGSETVKMNAVCGKWDDKTGVGDDNTYAKYSPSGSFEIQITNEAVFGMFEPGKKYYLDITPEPVTDETPAE